MNMSKSLDDFSQSYKEAMQYQETCAVEGNSGRFSVYPFPPPTIESHSVFVLFLVSDSIERKFPSTSYTHFFSSIQTSCYCNEISIYSTESTFSSYETTYSISFIQLLLSSSYAYSTCYEYTSTPIKEFIDHPAGRR